SIKCEPRNFYGYRKLWENLARSSAELRRELWQHLSATLLSSPERMDTARETIMMVARRFGVAEAEETMSAWKGERPGDPEVAEAYADLLLELGNGRTDAQRALQLLQPAVDRFPYHEGLRFSLADAQRKLGNFQKAEEILEEIIRRHPENSSAQVQLARVHERHGRIEEAIKTLAVWRSRARQNVEIREANVRILLGAGRLREARALLDQSMAKFPKSVSWRERAIQLYVDCGDEEAAVQSAWQGVVEYPRGSYLWFLVGRTLNAIRWFAGKGEVE